jgi:hypothetical protein
MRSSAYLVFLEGIVLSPKHGPLDRQPALGKQKTCNQTLTHRRVAKERCQSLRKMQDNRK